MGLVLRGAFVWEISLLDYRNMMHGHSHVAMLGWVYLALYILIGDRFIPSEKWSNPVYTKLFWFTQFTVVGMMISFPIQGYGAISITFSALHILASYGFIYLVWRDHRITKPAISLMLKTALVLMGISTIGVWSLGPIIEFDGRNSMFYQLAVQFYLHFQFHGWFTFALLALLLDIVSKKTLIHSITFKKFYAMLLASVILTYGLVLSWGFGGTVPLIVNGLGLLLQLVAMLLYLKLLKDADDRILSNLSPSVKGFYYFGMFTWIAKVAVQLAVLLPAAAAVALVLRPLMIGFIHLTLLGFVSGLLFALIFGSLQFSATDSLSYWGKVSFFSGFVLTELMLFVQGLFYWFQWGQLPAFYELIFGASLLLPLAIVLLGAGIIKHFNVRRIRRVELV